MSERGQRLGYTSLVCVAAMLAVSACDASDPPPAGSTTPTANSSSPSASASTAAGSTRDLDPPLALAPDDQVLIEPMSGTGSATTGEFEVDREKYTIRIACIGDDPITVSPGRQKMDVPCDGTMRRIHVATDAKRVRVSVIAPTSQRWSLAVVVTDDFNEVRPTPTLTSA